MSLRFMLRSAAGSVFVLWSIGVHAQTPQFGLTFDAPAEVTGEAGTHAQYTATARLSTSGIVTTDGAEGWSLGIAASGVEIVSATTAGTASALVAQGGLRLADGFEKIEILSAGAAMVCAIVLSSGTDISLPPSGTANILKVTARAVVPNPIVSAGQFLCDPLVGALKFVDGLRGSGQPVINKASYRGFGYRPTLGSASTNVCPKIIKPTFTYSFAAPAGATAAAGSVASFDGQVKLNTVTTGGSDGAEGWSVSAACENGTIVSATVAGTAGDLEANGGFRKPDGFEKTQLTSGAGNEGVVSAVVLSSAGGVSLPPAGTQTILKVGVQALAPQPGRGLAGEEVCEPKVVRLYFVDGRKGSGQPVQNKVGHRGLGYHPTLRESRVNVCPEVANAFRFRVDVLDPPATSDGPVDGFTAWTVEVETGAGTVPVTAGVVLESRMVGKLDGVRGWSLAIRTDPEFGVTSVTTAGTAVDGLFNGGFNRTELINPALNDGSEGVVSAVTLAFSDPVWLPPSGDSLVLRIVGAMDRGAVPGPGQEGPAAAVEIVDPDSPGLHGATAGQLVVTRVSLVNDALVVEARKPDVHGASIRLVGAPPPPGSSFVRGNANNDPAVDISDPVYTLNFLFLGGPGFVCDDAADGNDDGHVDISDPIYVLNYLFLGGPQPPIPFPVCGIDPSGDADGVTCAADQTSC